MLKWILKLVTDRKVKRVKKFYEVNYIPLGGMANVKQRKAKNK